MNDNYVKAALLARLVADSALTGMLGDGATGIYDGQTKQGARFPAVVFSKPSGVPSYTMGQRAYDDQLWQVKAITQGPSFALAGSIVARVDSLLDDQPLTLGAGSVLCLRRAYDVPEYPETADGARFNHKGSVYRLFVS